jgi:alkylation response protein AidB-like acyl-CoA dehydrogenase
LAYSKEREAFGQKIGQFQGIAFKLADMKTRIEASRLLTYNAAMAKERSKTTGGRFSLEASMAKLFASETATFVADEAVQIHGGWATAKNCRLSVTTGMPRSRRSMKAPARSNAW